jgi:uncharacterized protein (DUF169 family)
MTDVSEYNSYGEKLESYFSLRTSPIAVKMLEKEDDIPEGAIRPSKDMGTRIAQCQAFALSRRERKPVAMLMEDNNCFAPPIAYGLVDKPDDQEYKLFMRFPAFERDKYTGIVSAPLKTANFEPDVVIIYSNTAQMRSLIMPLHFTEKEDELQYHFFPPVCSYLLVPVIENQKCLVALPDPGEHMRALPSEDEIIISIPVSKMSDIMDGMKKVEEYKQGYRDINYMMNYDFPHPPLYQDLFKRWGMG